MSVWSRRKHPVERKLSEREEKDKEEAMEAQDLELGMEKLIEKRPESRLKWLTKALLFVGRKNIKASTLYEIIMDKAFLIGIDAKTGSQMKASILANGHLFSSKQQKVLESPTNHFNTFATAEKAEKKGKKRDKEKEKEHSGRDSDRRGRDLDFRDERRDRDRRDKDNSGDRDDRRDRDKRDRDNSGDRDDRREKDSTRRRAASEDRGNDRRKRRREPSSDQDDIREEQDRRPRKSEKAEATSARPEKRSSRRAEEEPEQEISMDPRMFAPGAADDGR